MRTSRWSLDLVIGVLIATCAATPLTLPLAAQPVARDWPTFRARALLTWPVRVFSRTGEPVVGEVQAIDSAQLVLRRGTERLAFPASAITRVERENARAHRLWTRDIPLGMLIGGTTLMLIDAGSGNPEPGEAFGMGAVLFGVPLGAVLNAVRAPPALYLAPLIR